MAKCGAFMKLQQVASFDNFVGKDERLRDVRGCISGIITHVSERISASFGKKQVPPKRA